MQSTPSQPETYSRFEYVGEKIGFGTALFVFVSALYTVLHFTHKIPASVSYQAFLFAGGIIYVLWFIRSTMHHETSDVIF